MSVSQGLLAGGANATFDGVAFQLVGELKWSPSLVNRESLIGMDGIHGFSEKPVAPFISMKLRDSAGITVADFNAMQNVTVILSLNSGKVVIGRNMWTTGVQEVDSTDATLDIRMEGPFVEEA